MGCSNITKFYLRPYHNFFGFIHQCICAAINHANIVEGIPYPPADLQMGMPRGDIESPPYALQVGWGLLFYNFMNMFHLLFLHAVLC